MSNATTTQQRRLKSVIVLLAAIAGCSGAASYAVHGLAGPAGGTVLAKQGNRAGQTTHTSTYELDGNYLSFGYPNSFAVAPGQAPSSGALQQNRLSSTIGGAKSLVITVTSLPSGRLDDDPSFHMRTLNPQTYRLTPQTIAGDHVIVAAYQNSYQEVAFWPHAGKLATIALSGTTTNQSTTEAMFQSIIQSITWQ